MYIVYNRPINNNILYEQILHNYRQKKNIYIFYKNNTVIFIHLTKS